ncbi:MAG: nitroreductase [Phenylobacterium sp.]
MDVREAVEQRTSIRAFTPHPVPQEVIRRLLAEAGRAPSGGNLQPWVVHVLAGPALDALKRQAQAHPAGETPEYEVYPAGLWDPYRRRRFECGEDLYATVGVRREDRSARLGWFRRNATLFDAPVGLFFCIDRRLGPPQWADLGMVMQTIMLLATEAGLATCAQEYWSRYPRTLAGLLGLPAEQMVFAGMALGWPDAGHPMNTLRTRREALDGWATFHGF